MEPWKAAFHKCPITTSTVVRSVLKVNHRPFYGQNSHRIQLGTRRAACRQLLTNSKPTNRTKQLVNEKKKTGQPNGSEAPTTSPGA